MAQGRLVSGLPGFHILLYQNRHESEQCPENVPERLYSENSISRKGYARKCVVPKRLCPQTILCLCPETYSTQSIKLVKPLLTVFYVQMKTEYDIKLSQLIFIPST